MVYERIQEAINTISRQFGGGKGEISVVLATFPIRANINPKICVFAPPELSFVLINIPLLPDTK
jgi:hypothetical protein